MRDEELAVKILRSVFKSVKIPVTLKMRTGWDDSSRNAPKLAKIAEDIGISMITIHGRTRCQMYKGKSDWAFIKKVKDAVKIPVIANGDVENFNDVNNILEISSADGLMIGRGTYGKPWIFKDISSKFNNKKKFEISLELKKSIILEHFNLSLEHYGIDVGVRNFRKHLGWYSKSFKNSNLFREKINNTLDYKVIEKLTNDFFCYENI